jgi:thiosulfate dehydrogenase [quinone] large subunit
LLSGFMVRVSAPFGILLMLVYYCAHMDFPFVEDHLNLIMDFHLVYAAVLFYLIKVRAGHAWGLDAIAEKLAFFSEHPALRELVQ